MLNSVTDANAAKMLHAGEIAQAADAAVAEPCAFVVVAPLDPPVRVAVEVAVEVAVVVELTMAAAVYECVVSMHPVSFKSGNAKVDGSLTLDGIYPYCRPLRYDQASMSY